MGRTIRYAETRGACPIGVASLVLMMAGWLIVRSFSTLNNKAAKIVAKKEAINDSVMTLTQVTQTVFSTTSIFGLKPSRQSLLMSP